MGTQKCEPFEHQAPIVFTRDSSMFVMGTPNHGLTFFNMDTMTTSPNTGGSGLGGGYSQINSLNMDSTNEPKYVLFIFYKLVGINFLNWIPGGMKIYK